MKFEYATEINVPVDFAYARATDFPKFEVEGFGNISKFKPVGDARAPDIGARWKVESQFQGRPRKFSLELRELANNKKVVFGNCSEKFDVTASFHFTRKGPDSTAFVFQIDSSAKTVAARLVMQTLQLARGRIEKKIARDFENMRARMEAQYKGE